MRRAVFVDRDGVINRLVPDPGTGASESPLRAKDVALIDGAAQALRRLHEAGWALIGVSNQPAAAKGMISVDELNTIQGRVLELVAAHGVRFDDFRLCLHHPDGVVAELSGRCDCRKPEPGMLLDAAAALAIDLSGSWMVGDTDADVLAGQAAGCRTVLVDNPDSSHKRRGTVAPDAVVADLGAAANELLRSAE